MTQASMPHVLVVDDERAVLSATIRALEEEGFLCQGALNGAEALQAIETTRFDLVITDLLMPVMHGHALVTKLIEMSDPPLVIVLSAVADRRVVMDLFSRGVLDVVSKPVDYGPFVAKIKNLIAMRGRPQETPDEEVAVRVSRQIGEVTANLQEQLKTISSNFQSTIDTLKKQEAELEDSYLGSVRLLANLFEQAGVNEGSHAGRVEAIVSELGPLCGIEGLPLRSLKVAALLHEIGQFGLPDSIRHKPPWELTPVERAAYERYPVISATLLSQVPGPEAIVEFLESHAENHDGSGFPDGKEGHKIPLGARIIRLADGIDTFRMGHRESKTLAHETRIHLRESSGTLYDPNLVEIALRHLESLIVEQERERTMHTPASQLRAGQKLAEDLMDSSGLLLGRRGMQVTENMLPRLRKALGNTPVLVVAP
ncbi:MAG: Cyclic di-GMP phosphodiesterase [bacterium]|nr:Cyclic di-GMP phosphodiesterase [bacterium]